MTTASLEETTIDQDPVSGAMTLKIPKVKMGKGTWAGATGLIAFALYVHAEFIMPRVAAATAVQTDEAIVEYDKTHGMVPHKGTATSDDVNYLIEKLDGLATQSSVDLIHQKVQFMKEDLVEVRADVKILQQRE